VNGLKESGFAHPLPNGWTVGVALAHLAFWDLSQVARLRRWKDQGVKPASIDAEAINGPLAALSEGLQPKAVAKLVIDAAESIDRLVESLTPEEADELIGMGLERNMHRAQHRRLHLEKIEKALKV
ncbi:MAG TPA: hypothetical protein VJ873_13965, partial [bacterium]|nr:hypothetical protein [bacterium]